MKRVLPIIIILIGIALRWDSLNWARPYYFHPDEVRLMYAVNDISWHNPNPKFFAYGSLPIYLLKIVDEAGKALAQNTPINQWLARLAARPLALDDFFLTGRALSALFASLTLILLYLFGRRFFSSRVALWSTAFLSFTVLHIQLAHFLTVDVMLTFLILLAMYFMAAIVAERPARLSPFASFALLENEGQERFSRIGGNYLLAGIAIGLALATKISALPLYLVLLGAHLLRLLKKSRPAGLLWGLFMVSLVLSVVVFLGCEPYAFLDFKEFYRQTKEQSDMVRGLTQPPYVIQYEKTAPYLYHLKHLLLYGMGLPLGFLTLAGSLGMILAMGFRLKAYLTDRLKGFDAYFTNADRVVLVILLWVLPVFATVGGFNVKFLRYMLPLIPFLCLLGAIWLEQLLQRFPAWKSVIYAIVSLTIGFAVFYAAAFVSVYHRPDPRVQASKWIYEHVKPGATLLTELWEFVSLVAVPGGDPGQYPTQGLELYPPDSLEKIQKLAQQLSQGDVIFLATKRLYGSILRVPERYPLTLSYYQQLFDGNLGFTPVQTLTNYPALFGVTFNDDFADESFSVYEHPKVILFQKTRQLSAKELSYRIITAPQITEPALLLKRLLAFPALEEQEKEKGSAAVSGFPQERDRKLSETRPAWQFIAIWLIAIELLTCLAFPLAMIPFRKFPTLGFAVAKVVGLLLPAYVVWLLVSLKLLLFTRGLIWGVIGCLLLASLLTWFQYRSFLLEIVRARWPSFVIQEEVFLLAFAAFLLFRAYNPDIFWSESSMDFSFLNVLTRTETLPPPDPWIAGYPLNYYYFGHYLVALLTRLTAIPPQITYNLAFALFPALVIVEVFSLLYQLTKRYRWGFVGVVFAAVIGNLDGFLLLIANWRGTEASYRFFRCAHEVIPYTVHEFPFWTFIFVDLHAHLFDMPVLLAVFLLGFTLLTADQNPLLGGAWGGSPSLRQGWGQNPLLGGAWGGSPSLRQGWGVFIAVFVSMLLVGTLGVISSWDYPTGIIFLLLIAAFKTYAHFRLGVRRLKMLLRPVGYVLGVLMPGSLLLYAPFYASFSRSGMGLGLVDSATTRLADFLTFFGFFGFVILSFLSFQAWLLRKNSHPWWAGLCLILAAIDLHIVAWNGWQVNYATLLFAISLLLFGSYLYAKQVRWQSAPLEEDTYIWLCLGYACLIIAGCEIVYVRDFLQGGEWKRMNTIFKFYIPVWFLLSFVATYYLSRFHADAARQKCLVRPSPRRYVRRLWFVGFSLLFLMSAVFPVMGPYARRHQDVYQRTWLPPTLNGLAYLNATNPDEYQAIRWLNENIAGTPVILEAVGSDYQYEYARISANTGLPTVLGWGSHAEQREHWGQSQPRVLDMKDIYTSQAIEYVLLLLKRYNVAYIYIGAIERRDFPEAGLKKFQEYPKYFEQVFQTGQTLIYRVK